MRAKSIFGVMVLSCLVSAAQPAQLALHGEGSSHELAQAVVANADATGYAHIFVVFGDGEVLEVNASKRDAQGYLDRLISEEVFIERLQTKPATRGPLLLKKNCNPGAGMVCSRDPECGCSKWQSCRPGDPEADAKGCVYDVEPANTLRVGRSYVCRPGYVWAEDQAGCVGEVKCFGNQTYLEGRCYGASGGDGGLWCLMWLGLISLPALALAALALVAGVFIAMKAKMGRGGGV